MRSEAEYTTGLLTLAFKYMLVLLLAIPTQLRATEIREWRGHPLEVGLAVGQERIIRFNDNVEIAIPPSLKKYISVSSAQGWVYLKALNEFQTARIRVRLIKSQNIVLIDLKTIKTVTALEDIIIQTEQPKPKDAISNHSSASNNIGPIDLIRYASASLYLPPRLVPSGEGISPITVSQTIDLSQLFIGGSYEAFSLWPIAAWRSNGLYLTAIQMKNNTTISQSVRREDLNAKWLYFTTQHLTLTAIGTLNSQTTLYLITATPIQAALFNSRSSHG